MKVEHASKIIYKIYGVKASCIILNDKTDKKVKVVKK